MKSPSTRSPLSRLFTRVAATVALTAAAASAAPKPAGDPNHFAAAPDWKAEVVLAHPDILFTSVVCCAPDGRVFVAEDPADMPGPPAQPVDRILCLWPDGHKTVFADHLRAVFGLQYLDGKLYVHQVPIFSVFTDDHGVGRDRVDLIGTTNPDPTAGGGFNDHIPSNFRLAMDGYFYMSSGDKGIFRCESNVDHRKAEIHGGGVLRIRPDGTGLEVYCTGTRNHLDVAIDAEDEIFTSDNTDDGQGWWTRFSHMVDGGYYGYPFDYKDSGHPDDKTRDHEKPFQPYTLWRISDKGGGSPTGEIAYNEDALPEEYRGNVIVSEWGRGQLERYVVERDGGTFKEVKYDPKFLSNPGGQFRPVGLAWSADGMSLYCGDWNYGGWRKGDSETGRLVKLTYTGKSLAAPKPAWFIPAAEGQKFEASTADLIAGLSHPAQSVRLVAQRRLGERGAEAVAPLVALLNNAGAAPFARWSAVWALDRIDGGKAGREAVLAVAKDPKADVSVRRQAIRQLGTRAAREATQALIAALNDPDASIRFRAATALGRIGDAAAAPALSARLDEPDFFAHYAIFLALRRIGQADPKAWPVIVQGFASDKAAVREGTACALHDAYDSELVRALTEFVNSKAAGAARGQALLAEAELHRQPKPWDGKWWGTQPAGHLPPPKDADWDGTTTVLNEIRVGLSDADPAVRQAAVRAMQIAPDPSAAAVLVDLFGKDPSVETRRSVLEALGAGKSPAAGPLIAQVLADPSGPLAPDAVSAAEQVGGKPATDALLKLVNSDAGTKNPKLIASAVAALGTLKDAGAVESLARHLSDGNEVAPAAATALGQIGGKPAVQALIAALSDARPEVRKAAAASLGALKAREAVPALVKAAADKEAGGDAILALTRMPTAEATDAYLEGLAGRDALLRKQCLTALTEVRDAARPRIDAKVESGELKGNTLALVQQVYNTYQPLTVWSVVGPFKAGGAQPFDPEKGPIHADGDVKAADGKVVKWRKARGNGTEHGLLNLGELLGSEDMISAWAVTDFTSATERDVEFQAGSDDTLTVWLNGAKIFDQDGDRGWNYDAFHFKGHVKAGRNTLVVRCDNHSGGWEFSIEVGAEHTGKLFQTVAARKPDRDAYGRFALSHEGNPENGSRIFHNAQTVACLKCHETGHNDGGQVGPSLAGVGAKYDRAKLIESVVYPSAQIFDGYEQTFVRTKDGDVQAGVVRGEDEQTVTLFDSAAKKWVIQKSDIESRKVSKISLMPEGLEQGLSEQEFADLIAYLQSLKDKPAGATPAQPGRR